MYFRVFLGYEGIFWYAGTNQFDFSNPPFHPLSRPASSTQRKPRSGTVRPWWGPPSTAPPSRETASSSCQRSGCDCSLSRANLTLRFLPRAAAPPASSRVSIRSRFLPGLVEGVEYVVSGPLPAPLPLLLPRHLSRGHTHPNRHLARQVTSTLGFLDWKAYASDCQSVPCDLR